MKRLNATERFWKKVSKTDTCWNWLGTLNESGYPIFFMEHRNYRAHRVSYEWSGHKIPKKFVIDHLCRNTKCVNPSHLRAVTDEVNILAGTCPSAMNARKTHCKRGHIFTGINLIVFSRKKGKDGRRCRTCRDERNRKRYL